MILMLDNYDSFTYNVVQYLSELGAEVQVYRNDEITINDIKNNILLRNLPLIKQSRLSVMPIDTKSWKIILKMSNINKK